jgi:hypothetical protein
MVSTTSWVAVGVGGAILVVIALNVTYVLMGDQPRRYLAVRGLRELFVGAALVVGGIAAFIEANSHRPLLHAVNGSPYENPDGISQTAYDLIHIGGATLLVFGVLLVVVGLIGYARMSNERRT